MGVTHSMEEQQVKRISKALNASATAIQGINKKFEDIDVHVQRMLEFNNTTNQKMDAAFRSFERLDDTFNDRAEMFLEALVGATNSATDCLEAAVLALQKVNIRQEIDNIPKALIPLAIPFIILLIELAVSNAYLGILLASLPSVSLRYSNYLLAYASSTLLGLFLSLTWLVCYRVYLSCRGKDTSTEAQTVELLHKLRTRSATNTSLDSETLSQHSEQQPRKSTQSDLSKLERQATLDLGMDQSAKDRARAAERRLHERRHQRLLRRAETSRNLEGFADDASWVSQLSPAAMSPEERSPTTSHHLRGGGSPPVVTAVASELPPDAVRQLLENQLPKRRHSGHGQAEASDEGRLNPGAAFRRVGRTRSAVVSRARSSSEEASRARSSSDEIGLMQEPRPVHFAPPDRGGSPMASPSGSDIPPASPEALSIRAQDEAVSSSSPGNGSHATMDKGTTERRQGTVQTRWNSWDNPFGMSVTWGRKGPPAQTSPASGRRPSATLQVVSRGGREETEEFGDGEHLSL